MATGYTAQLEYLDYDVYRWLTEDIPRAMGMCINLRDMPSKLTKDQIREKITSNPNSAELSLKRDRELLQEGLSKTAEQWGADLKEAIRADEEYTAKRKEEWIYKKDKHLESAYKINSLLKEAKDVDEVTYSVLSFAKGQLDSVIDHDYSVEHKPSTDAYGGYGWEEYRDMSLSMAKESVSLSKKRLRDLNNSNEERLKAFDTYINFVETLKYKI